MKRFVSTGFLLIAIICLFTGCAQKISLMEPKPHFRVFEEKCTHRFEMPIDSIMAGVSVLSVPQIVLAEINLSDAVREILYVKLYEDDRLLIDRHLVRNMEYAFDREKNFLKVILDLPVIYLLPGHVHFKIKVAILKDIGDQFVGEVIEKQVSFFWAPHIWTVDSSGYAFLEYVDPIKGNYLEKKKLIHSINEESLITNTSRMTGDFRTIINTFTLDYGMQMP